MPDHAPPRPLADEAACRAALDELMALDTSDPASAARWTELTRQIDDYHALRAGYDLPRMRAALAARGRP